MCWAENCKGRECGRRCLRSAVTMATAWPPAGKSQIAAGLRGRAVEGDADRCHETARRLHLQRGHRLWPGDALERCRHDRGAGCRGRARSGRPLCHPQVAQQRPPLALGVLASVVLAKLAARSRRPRWWENKAKERAAPGVVTGRKDSLLGSCGGQSTLAEHKG